MGQGSNLIFNVVTLIFVALALITGIVVLGVMTGSMDPPILAPKATEATPTFFIIPTVLPPGALDPAAVPPAAETPMPSPGPVQ